MTYPDGRPYIRACGRDARREGVEDRSAVHSRMAVVDLDGQRPSKDDFLKLIQREFKIRYYRTNTCRNYVSHVRRFLTFLDRPPHTVCREDVRCYLEYLVDAGLDASSVANHLSSIRTVFDKLCFRETTLGLCMPRQAKRQPKVLGESEVQRLIESAISRRDKLCLALMYAAGLRVSEVVRLKFCDLNFSRSTLCVRRGKGAKDRTVPLPSCLTPMLRALSEAAEPDEYLFPAEGTGARRGDHLSPRTVQRMVERAARVAKLKTIVSPHVLRHSFATHSFEHGCDIRRIQTVLGHASLETTTIYVRVATHKTRIPSPLDHIIKPTAEVTPNSAAVESHGASTPAPASNPRQALAAPMIAPQKQVGRLALELTPDCEQAPARCSVRLSVKMPRGSVCFEGIEIDEPRPGWLRLTVPAIEAWKKPLQQLTRAQQARFFEADFYEYLESHIGSRFLALRRRAKMKSRGRLGCTATRRAI